MESMLLKQQFVVKSRGEVGPQVLLSPPPGACRVGSTLLYSTGEG